MNISPRILIVACVVLFILNGIQRGIYNSRSRKYESSEEAYLLKIDNVRYKHQVVPGDTLIFKLDLMQPIRRGICQMQGRAYANGKLVSEAEIMAQIIKVK